MICIVARRGVFSPRTIVILGIQLIVIADEIELNHNIMYDR